jgi:23S rRNA-/tRNA-specific pseudouridylate synthase
MYLEFEDFYKNFKNLQTPKIIQTNDFYFLRKPHKIPSSFGKQKSILDMLENGELDENFTQNQLKFSKEQEYLLLNRLDNDTAGFLYFAKTPQTYEKFKKLQKENKIQKIYYAQCENTPFKTQITYPIMHKNKSKMIVIKSPKDIKK